LLWQTLHQTYNLIKNQQVNPSLLDKIPTQATIKWPSLFKEELQEATAKCKSSSFPGPDHITWCTLKFVLKDDICLTYVTQLANTCINLSFWPSHFKASISVIIPKLQKLTYNTLKSFHPIIFLNTLGKLIEKVISFQLQHHSIKNSFIHLNQLGGIQQRSTADTGIYLTHPIQAG